MTKPKKNQSQAPIAYEAWVAKQGTVAAWKPNLGLFQWAFDYVVAAGGAIERMGWQGEIVEDFPAAGFYEKPANHQSTIPPGMVIDPNNLSEVQQPDGSVIKYTLAHKVGQAPAYWGQIKKTTKKKIVYKFRCCKCEPLQRSLVVTIDGKEVFNSNK